MSDVSGFDNSFGPTLALRQIRRTFDFNDRATRTEVISYWVFALFCELAISALTIFMWGSAPWNTPWLFTTIAVVFAVPEPALFVRRLHDQARSGWWAVVGIPYALFAWFGGPRVDRPLWEHLTVAAVSLTILVFIFWEPSPGSNRFGPDPRLDPPSSVPFEG